MILFGVLFSLFRSSGSVRRSLLAEPAFWHGLVFTSIFNVAVIYAIIYFPDWMWMYFLVDSQNSFTELAYLFVFLYYLPYVFGFYLGRDLNHVSWGLSFLVILALLATEVWLILTLFDRYSVVGTRDQYLAGTATSLFDPANPLGPALNGSVILMAVYFVFFVLSYRKKRRWLKP